MIVVFVYILYSPSTGLTYKGHTDALADRVKRHNSGMEQSTKQGAPWQLLWYTVKPDRSQAMILERKLKNLNRYRLLHFMQKYSRGFVDSEAEKLVQEIMDSSSA